MLGFNAKRNAKIHKKMQQIELEITTVKISSNGEQTIFIIFSRFHVFYQNKHVEKKIYFSLRFRRGERNCVSEPSPIIYDRKSAVDSKVHPAQSSPKKNLREKHGSEKMLPFKAEKTSTQKVKKPKTARNFLLGHETSYEPTLPHEISEDHGRAINWMGTKLGVTPFPSSENIFEDCLWKDCCQRCKYGPYPHTPGHFDVDFVNWRDFSQSGHCSSAIMRFCLDGPANKAKIKTIRKIPSWMRKKAFETEKVMGEPLYNGDEKRRMIRIARSIKNKFIAKLCTGKQKIAQLFDGIGNTATDLG